MNWCAFSVDFDSIEEYARAYPISKDPGLANEAYVQSAEMLAAFLHNNELAATLFIVTSDIERPARAKALKALQERGHELGLHSHSHQPALDEATLGREFDESVALLRELTGATPRGYRAPSYVMHDFVHAKMIQHQLAYSSSVLGTPLILLFKVLFNLKTIGNGGVPARERLWNWGRPQAVLSPKRAYLPCAESFWRASATGEFVEIPLTCVPWCGVPFQFTYLAPLSDRVVRRLGGLLSGQDVNTSFHLMDFVDDDLARRVGPFNPNLRLPLEERLRKATLLIEMSQQGRQRRLLHEVAVHERRRINDSRA